MRHAKPEQLADHLKLEDHVEKLTTANTWCPLLVSLPNLDFAPDDDDEEHEAKEAKESSATPAKEREQLGGVPNTAEPEAEDSLTTALLEPADAPPCATDGKTSDDAHGDTVKNLHRGKGKGAGSTGSRGSLAHSSLSGTERTDRRRMEIIQSLLEVTQTEHDPERHLDVLAKGEALVAKYTAKDVKTTAAALLKMPSV